MLTETKNRMGYSPVLSTGYRKIFCLHNKTCESKGEALPAKPRTKPIKPPSFGKGGAGGGFFFAVILSLSLTACSGFKPRTERSVTQTPLIGQQVSIGKNKLKPDFLAVLEKGLRDSGAMLGSEVTPGVIEVKITGLEEDKTVSAYSSVRQVREFNHFIELDFEAARKPAKGAANSKNNRKIVDATVRAERTQIYDSRFVLGVSEEERIIRDELRVEVVRLLALRLAVLR